MCFTTECIPWTFSNEQHLIKEEGMPQSLGTTYSECALGTQFAKRSQICTLKHQIGCISIWGYKYVICSHGQIITDFVLSLVHLTIILPANRAANSEFLVLWQHARDVVSSHWYAGLDLSWHSRQSLSLDDPRSHPQTVSLCSVDKILIRMENVNKIIYRDSLIV